VISFSDMIIKRGEKLNIPEEMVLIPEGQFLMGSTEDDVKKLLELDSNVEASRFDVEVPQREIHLSPYLIDKCPVTNAEYKKFVVSGGYKQRDYWSEAGWNYIIQVKPLDGNDLNSAMDNDDECPVVNISWYEAEAFAKYMGKRLPTEAEWEKAARGTDGKVYPWGNEFDKTKLNCSEARIEKTTPVDKYVQGRSEYGCFDMAGNVWEWTADWFDSRYYSSAPDSDPQGPDKAEDSPFFGRPEDVGTSIYEFEPPEEGDETLSGCRVMRGGSWSGGGVVHIRCANRDYDEPDYKNETIGFRCARSLT